MPEFNNDFELRKNLKEKYGNEVIYVYSYKIFEGFNNFFTPLKENFLYEINESGFFISRYMAEYNSFIYQPIPYIIIIHSQTKKLFVTKRLGGEERLLEKYSFVGGHVNYSDINIDNNIIKNAAYRELAEEIQYTPTENRSLKFFGILKDENSNTSEHIGFTFLQVVDSARVKETDKLAGFWLSLEEAEEKINEFESWGQILIKEIKNRLNRS